MPGMGLGKGEKTYHLFIWSSPTGGETHTETRITNSNANSSWEVIEMSQGLGIPSDGLVGTENW